MKIIYEDNHLLVLDKPAGVLTQPNESSTPNLLEEARHWIKVTYDKPGNVFLEPIHRLDKPVSGVVVFCKTSKSLSRMNAFIRNKETKKMYLAWVEGIPPLEEGRLEHWLLHDEFRAQIVPSTFPQAKKATLSYQVIEKKEQRTLLEISLETGRYHQIRVQMAAMECPIWGDAKYGSTQFLQKDTIALVHKKFQIPHPITKEWMVLESSIPSYFSSL